MRCRFIFSLLGVYCGRGIRTRTAQARRRGHDGALPGTHREETGELQDPDGLPERGAPHSERVHEDPLGRQAIARDARVLYTGWKGLWAASRMRLLRIPIPIIATARLVY